MGAYSNHQFVHEPAMRFYAWWSYHGQPTGEAWASEKLEDVLTSVLASRRLRRACQMSLSDATEPPFLTDARHPRRSDRRRQLHPAF